MIMVRGAVIMHLRQLLFRDQARLVEVFSALNLLAWAHLLWSRPELVGRDSYAAFQGLGSTVWAFLLFSIAAVQLAPIVWQFRHAANLRFVAMAAASGAWFMIAANFISTGVSTTAGANYLLLSLVCMVSGVWLAWMSRN